MTSLPRQIGQIGRRAYVGVQTQLRPYLGETFELDGHCYRLFLHGCTETWRSERIVEVAIAKRLLEQAAGKRVLEIGNVVRKFIPSEHLVVDKYEVRPGVINEDAETFTADPFDAIISISTIEHIGWDEEPRDPGKIPCVIDHLRSLLNPGGTLTVTVPHGYNRDLDELLAAGALPFDQVRYLMRLDVFNHRWRQVDRSEVGSLQYGYPFVGASAIAVASLTR